MRRLPLVVAMVVTMVVAAPGWPSAQAATPDATAAEALVARYQAALTTVMKQAKTLSVQARARDLDGPLRETFDFARMAQAASGRAWRTADETARDAVVEAFARYSVAIHADRFDGYSGERFVIEGTAPGPGESLLVKTRIDRPENENVTLSYVIVETPEHGPRVVDVLMQGSISEVALRRSEWSAIGKHDGLAGLAQALDDLTDRMLTEDTAARTVP